ncbi:MULTISPECIES: hypothetical protein [unclassified Algibacter]|uniref:hypothetical protein n=1 Tax=unclassified Algibacter TaxID=2615009 RepID=UPI00131CDDC2|nr:MULTISPECIES: hypothetical protein [unclassified Algibacter]MCL5128258.1 hypothetical protein [Algibacter sp. L4_22]
MKTTAVKAKYSAWLSPEIMHKDSLKWLSELRFVKDEELFFDDLIKSYTIQLIDSKYFEVSKNLVVKLSAIQRETSSLIDTIINHENGLKIMVDGVNEFEKENAYKIEHGKLIVVVCEFLDNYRSLKTELFTLIKGVIKEGKQKRLTP